MLKTTNEALICLKLQGFNQDKHIYNHLIHPDCQDILIVGPVFIYFKGIPLSRETSSIKRINEFYNAVQNQIQKQLRKRQ